FLFLVLLFVYFFFFFFQAEDGIRDLYVTGVQTCALPISMTHHKQRNRLECHYCGSIQAIPKLCPKCQSKYVYFFGEGSEHLEERSEERRVGKECRSRWSLYH